MKKILSLVALSALAGAVDAQVTAYSNVTTFTGNGYANGGAAASAGTTYTAMVADDINLATGTAGRPITGFSFSVANLNSTAVSASALVRFYAADASTGGPGTLLSALNFNPITFSAGSVVVFNAPTSASGYFTSPTNGAIWAGILFSDTGSTTAVTSTQLNSLGQGLYNPPTVGSSQNVFFQATAGGSTATSSNPTGSFFNFGTSPVANFGWSFTTTNPVPEPSAFAALGLGAVAVLRRRKKA